MKNDVLAEIDVKFVTSWDCKESWNEIVALPMQLYVALVTGGEDAVMNYVRAYIDKEISYFNMAKIREARIVERGQVVKGDWFTYKISPRGEIIQEGIDSGSSPIYTKVLRSMPPNPKELLATITSDHYITVFALYKDGSFEQC